MSGTDNGSSPSSVPVIASCTPNFQSSSSSQLLSTSSSSNSPVSFPNHLPLLPSFPIKQPSQNAYNMSNFCMATPFESNNMYHDYRISASNSPSMPSTLLSPTINTNSNALLQDFDASLQIYGPQSREIQQTQFIVPWLHFSKNTRLY
jgi:hypothetical protein